MSSQLANGAAWLALALEEAFKPGMAEALLDRVRSDGKPRLARGSVEQHPICFANYRESHVSCLRMLPAEHFSHQQHQIHFGLYVLWPRGADAVHASKSSETLMADCVVLCLEIQRRGGLVAKPILDGEVGMVRVRSMATRDLHRTGISKAEHPLQLKMTGRWCYGQDHTPLYL